MTIKSIVTVVEEEYEARRESSGGVLLRRTKDDRIAEITKLLGCAWDGDFRQQMVAVAAAAVEAVEQCDFQRRQAQEFDAQFGAAQTVG